MQSGSPRTDAMAAIMRSSLRGLRGGADLLRPHRAIGRVPRHRDTLVQLGQDDRGELREVGQAARIELGRIEFRQIEVHTRVEDTRLVPLPDVARCSTWRYTWLDQ
ncbi:hypothetical protein [Amycolatopsis methanolica]|uniref:hypothetical protein n=1 Tax=Amycolatopsis methanolica TaxID=1814 RepID=UPI000363D119|nr:hypothetical protein [Amycolatopsis methanolica]